MGADKGKPAVSRHAGSRSSPRRSTLVAARGGKLGKPDAMHLYKIRDTHQ